ncbi:MAG: Gfo/Idh/MocA family oxidoreductase [Chloroflexota bacterium]
MDPIGVGIVGYGLAGRSFHAPFVEAVDGLWLEAVVTTDPERRARATAEHPGAAIFESVEEMLARTDIEVVVVATPNRLHVPIGLRVFAAGRHVVVDKPIAMDVREAETLIDAATRSGRLLSVYQNRRWDGDFLTVRRLISEGVLGPIDSLESRFERLSRVGPEWRESGQEAAGPLRDLGAHLVDQSVILFGPARRVWAQLDRRRPATEVDDSTFVAIDHESGVRSRLWMSVIASHVGPRIRLRGVNGEYVKDDLDVQEAQLVGGMLPSSPGFGDEPGERSGRLYRPDGAMSPIPTERGRYIAFYELLRDAIRGLGPVPVDPIDSLRVLRVLIAAEVAAKTGTVQTMGDV